jgi:hypothetical protein
MTDAELDTAETIFNKYLAAKLRLDDENEATIKQYNLAKSAWRSVENQIITRLFSELRWFRKNWRDY